MKLSDISIHAWIDEFKIKNEAGVQLDFTDHLYLFDIYRDNSPKLVCYKAAQIGFTTMALLKSIWLAKTQKMDIIYTMPTSGDIREIIGGKISRMLANNPILVEYAKDKDSIEQKQFGDNIIYYRPSWTERAALGISADLIINDEEDRSKQDIIQQYASRLQHSEHKWEWHFSNPSVEGNGVSRYWAKSDQKHWFIKCVGCNTQQFLSWPESIDMERRCFQCKKCKKELTREERRAGQWVRKFKDREYSGYWISLLMAPWITAGEIITYYETKSAEYFANFVEGLPYVGEGNQVTPDVIYRNCTQTVNNQERVVIGCDSGLKKHYVLGNKDGLFYHGVTDTWDTIRGFLRDYKRSIAVIDALPDLTEPRKLREEFPGRVFLCHYARDRKTYQLIRWGKNEEAGNVTVDRNRMMQMVIDDFANRKIPLQGSIPDWEPFQEHFASLYKTTEVDTLGVPQSVWHTSNGQDHFAHACFLGDTLITTDRGSVPIKDVKVGDMVLTRKGYEPVSYSGLIRADASVMEVSFSNGSKLVGTHDHRIWTKTRGFVALYRLTKNDTFEVCQNNQYCTRESDTILMENISDVTQARGYISQFGKNIMDKYRKALLFITRIGTRKIMILPTLSYCLGAPTHLYTKMRSKRRQLSGVHYVVAVLYDGTRGIINTAVNIVAYLLGKLQYLLLKTVLFVTNSLQRLNIRTETPAHEPVEVRKCGSREIETKHPVYGITVGDSHEYYANDILVANSLYWRVGMDRFKNDGGKVFTGEPELAPSPYVGPDETTPWKPSFVYPDKEENDDWRNA